MVERGEGRCAWAKPDDPLYVVYHDEEWGVPERDAEALWAKLVLDGFQAGLSWITILHKREAFLGAFAGLDPDKVARFGETDRARLLADSSIVRSAAKIDATIAGARIFLSMREAGEDFSGFLWDFVGGCPVQNAWERIDQVPASSPAAEAMARGLKQRGFKFCGPVIVYAFMQATGMVNDHLVGCFRHGEVGAMAS
ncbi:MAG: DNA-3-methyladenine glycosylase I [Caulobacteraceae bacterium]